MGSMLPLLVLLACIFIMGKASWEKCVTLYISFSHNTINLGETGSNIIEKMFGKGPPLALPQLSVVYRMS